MQDEEGFDDNPKLELVDFNYKPLVIHPQLKRRPTSKPLSLEGWQFARDVNSGQVTRTIIQKQPQNIVYSSYLRETVIQDVQLQFQAEFQSSNLELVVRRRFLEFQIYIQADTNTNAYQQWFYFRVKSCKGPKTASFTIKNLAKSGMLYESGLKPYYRRRNLANYQQIPGAVKYYQNVTQDSFCLRFSFQFLHQGEQVQFCSQPPYTYTKLLNFLSQRKIEWKSLCKSQLGKKVPYLTFYQQKTPKAYAIVIARQHPGQSVGSWMMQGLISKLKSSKSQGIQWLIIPMFNIDGVIVGNNRTGLSGFDYNRYWNTDELTKKQKHFPEIVAFINLMKFLKRLHPKKPKIVFDLHGHSSQPNIFSYGPPNQQNSEYYYISRAFPELLSRKNKNFNIEQCSYTIKPDKKNTARSFLFNQLMIPFVYTIEASFGIMRDRAVNQNEFIQFGKDLVDVTHEFMCTCLIGEKSPQVSSLIEAVKARGENEQAEQFDSDSERQQKSPKKTPITQRNTKFDRIRIATQVCHRGSQKQQQNTFQLFKIQENSHQRYQKTVDKRRNHTQVGLNNIKKNHFLPKLKQSCSVKNRASSSLKQEQIREADGSLMNIKQIQKRLFRLRNSRIGKKILIINAYGI